MPTGFLIKTNTKAYLKTKAIIFSSNNLCKYASISIKKSCNIGTLLISQAYFLIRIHSSIFPRYCHFICLCRNMKEGFTDIASTKYTLLCINAVRQFLRSEPSSRSAFIGEQPNPWNVLPLQDAKSRHRGAKPPRRCELLGEISLLSLE